MSSFEQQQLFLFTNNKKPANYTTKWADLHPHSHKLLLLIGEKILEYRDQSVRLDQCSRFFDSSISNATLKLNASHIVQELGGISTSLERNKVTLHELMDVAKKMLRNAEFAIRSFMILRLRFHQKAGAASNPTASTPTLCATIPGNGGQASSNTMVPVIDFYSGVPKKPSSFMLQTVGRFEKYLGECGQCIAELEQLLISDSDRSSISFNSSVLQSLPKVLTNVHEFFVLVAAKVHSTVSMVHWNHKVVNMFSQANGPFVVKEEKEEAVSIWFVGRGLWCIVNLGFQHPAVKLVDLSTPVLRGIRAESMHQYIGSMRTSYLMDRRRRGNVGNPFLEADRREIARKEAAAKRAHPTLHLPAAPQPMTQVAGLVASSGTPVTPVVSIATQTSGAPSSSSGLGFSTPLATPSTTPPLSLFSTPAVAGGSSLFSSSGASPQSSPFASSTPSLYGLASAPSLFPGSNPASAPAGGSLFSSPIGSGPALGSESNVVASKRSKPKSRTRRR